MPTEGYMDAAAVPVPDAADDELREQLARVLDRHITERDYSEGCPQPCGHDGTDRDLHLAGVLMPTIRAHIAKAAPERWWICTDALAHGGKKLLGPFQSRDLALEVRVYYEAANEPTTYWVDREEAVRDR